MVDWRSNLTGVGVTTLGTALLVGVLVSFRSELGLHNVGFVLLFWTLLIAATWGRKVGFFAAVLTNLALNFFFVEPLHHFIVNEPRNIVALVVFLAVSVVAGSLLSVSRHAAAEARRRQAEAEVALRLSRAMSGHTEPAQALEALCREVTAAFDAPGAAVLTRSDGAWTVLSHAGHVEAGRTPTLDERAAAERAVSSGEVQSLGATGLSARPPRIVFPRGRDAAFRREQVVSLVPLQLASRNLGVLRMDGPIGETPFRDEPARLLSAVASEAAIAVERAELAREASHAAALREADAMKNALMASVSHDLKTPLATIKAAISSLMDRNVRWSEEDVAAFYQTIDSQSDRLNRVIGDILDLNRIESGDLTPEEEPLRVADLLSRARDVTAFEIKGRSVSIDADAGLRALGDEALVTQAIVNLIENAAKYSRPGGEIRLRAAAADDAVCIAVEDEGPGIAPEDMPHIFERFFRAPESSRRVKGSGLGLTIVKAFVELSGGAVRVESEPGATRFLITLPASKAQMAV